MKNMKRYLLLTIIGVTLLQVSSYGQSFKEKYFKGSSYIFDDLQKIRQAELFTVYKSEFGLGVNDVMVQTNNIVSEEGKFTTKYILLHKGIPVEGSMMNVIGHKGIVQYANGFLLTGLNVNTNNLITEQQAIEKAIQSVNSEKFIWEDTLIESSLKEETGNPNVTNYPTNIELKIVKNRDANTSHTANNYQLCYQVSIISLNPSFHSIIYVNANDGSIFTTSDAEIEDYSVTGTLWTAHNGWHNDMITNTCTFCSNYRLIDNGKNLKTGNVLTGKILKDGNNNWVESDTKTGASAHWSMQKVWDYYYYRHGRAGSNYSSKPIKVYTEKSMSSGTNLYYDPSIASEDRIFIRPNSSGYSAAMLDVIAHEYTHAMIHESSNLGIVSTDYEARSMAEGYADIFGMKIEGDIMGTHDWTFAENMGTYKRNFQNPHSDFPYPSPEIYLESGYWNPYAVHLNGGVLRKWFYLLSNGGTFNGNTVLPLGIETSTDIAYITFNWWLWSNLYYPEMASQTVQATIAHWGTCSKEHKQVVKALRAVGFNIPNPFCRRVGVLGPNIIDPVIGNLIEWKAVLNEIEDSSGTYQWHIPSDWNATAQGNTLILNGYTSTNSQKLGVTYTQSNGDQTSDTIIVHFSDVQWTPSNNMPIQPMNRTFEEKLEEINGFTLSPNPATNNVQITFTHFESNATIELYDINGRLIQIYDCNQPKFEFNVSNLNNGLYIIRTKMGEQIFSQKLSVIH